MRELKVGDWVRVVESNLQGFPVGVWVQVREVDWGRYPYCVTHDGRDVWFGDDGVSPNGNLSVKFASKNHIVALESQQVGTSQNAPWYTTAKGCDWLAKNMPEEPEELRTYRRGQVFTIGNYEDAFILASHMGKGGICLGLVNLGSGNRWGRSIPTAITVTHGMMVELVGSSRFKLVADSAEDYFKEKFNV